MQDDIGWPPPCWVWVINPYVGALTIFATLFMRG